LDALDDSTSVIVRENGNSSSLMRKFNLNNNISNSITNVEHIKTSLQKYMKLASKELQPGQTAINAIKNNFRFILLNIQSQLILSRNKYNESMTKGKLSNLESSFASSYEISVPYTALELYNTERMMNSFTIPITSNSSDMGIVSAIQMKSSVYGINDSFLSNSLEMMIAEGISCNSPNCTIEIILQYNSALKYPKINSRLLNDINTIENVEIQCSSNKIETKYHLCSNGDLISIPCNGSSTTIIYTCPQKTIQSVCDEISKNSFIPSTCKELSSTDYNITCSCEFENSKKISTSYIAMLDSVYTSFNLVYKSNITLSELNKEWYVSTIMGCFILIVCISILFGYYYDKQEENMKFYGESSSSFKNKSSKTSLKLNYRSNEIIPMQNNLFVRQKPYLINRNMKKYHNKFNNRKQKSLNSIKYLDCVEEVLPKVLHNKPFLDKFIYEIQQHHRWLGIIFHFSEVFPRTLRIIALMTNILVMMFFQALTYHLVNVTNNSSCEEFKSEYTCIKPKSSFYTGESMCQWDKSNHMCSFIQPDNSIHIVLFVAIFSAVLSTPINCLSHWIIKNYLSQPTDDSTLLIAAISSDSNDSNSQRITKSEKDFQNKNLAEMNIFIEDLRRYRESILDLSLKRQFDGK